MNSDVYDMNKDIRLKESEKLIFTLEQNGFEAYLVGGCVRDILLKKEPHDFDICTNAKPEDVLDIFKDHTKIIPTGLKHGTVTVYTDNGSYDITTYRIDGKYTDNRHPDSVTYTDNLTDDLSRRDFTINAMAYHPTHGFVDTFEGKYDFIRKDIRCVGNPEERFSEDPLRILRAIRFVSTLDGFTIEGKTEAALFKLRGKLNLISAERIQGELMKILAGKNILYVLEQYKDVFVVIIPELKACIGFDQNNKYHTDTVYMHTAHAVANADTNDPELKMALLLHDIGKPYCYSENETGGHFYGHAEKSYEMCLPILKRLRFSNNAISRISTLIQCHDAQLNDSEKAVRRLLHKFGEKILNDLLCIRIADAKAHKKGTFEKNLEKYYRIDNQIDLIVSERKCFSLRDLAINGEDLISLGYKEGPVIGEALNKCLTVVINGYIGNYKDALIEFAKNMKKSYYPETSGETNNNK